MTGFLVLSTWMSATIAAISYNQGDYAWAIVSGLTALLTLGGALVSLR